MWQQDGCSIHRTEQNFLALTEYHNEETCLYMGWPAKSPNLNLIENVWGLMQIKLDMMCLQKGEPTTAGELENRVHQVWGSITQDYLHKLYDSVPRRLQLVINNQGNPTKY